MRERLVRTLSLSLSLSPTHALARMRTHKRARSHAQVSEHEVAAAEEKFKAINTAYSILIDPAERRRYDLSFP